MIVVGYSICLGLLSATDSVKALDGFIDLILAPSCSFEEIIFLVNDWDGRDKDNQNVGEEVNRNSKIFEGVVVLSDIPDRDPKKVKVNRLFESASVLAQASMEGNIAIAMGAHSRHLLAWLTALPASLYKFEHIVVVTHSNWYELDGRSGYERNKQSGDKTLIETMFCDVFAIFLILMTPK